MSRHPRHEISRVIAGLIAIFFVFGLAMLMILQRYSPAVITSVVTGTSLAAAELVHRLQAPSSPPSGRDNTPEEHR
jgi:hypothetical protein